MRLAKTLLLAFPLCIALVNSASAALVFNLELVGSPIVNITAPPLTRTINVYAFENDPNAFGGGSTEGALQFTSPQVVVTGDPDISFSLAITPHPLLAVPNQVASTVTPGYNFGVITATVSPSASFLDLANVSFRATIAAYSAAGNTAVGTVITSNSIGITAVPEPGTFGLLAMGGMGLAFMRRRRS